MALINCPECGKEISDSSDKCIHCGYPLKVNVEKPKKKKAVIIVIIVVIVVIVLIALAIAGFIFFGSKLKNNKMCQVEGCNNPIYTNGYCIDHYGQKKQGEEITTSNENSVNSDETEYTVGEGIEEGFEEDEVQVVSFTKNSKITTDSCEFTLKGYSIASKIEPSNFSGYYYHYYEASSGNVYVDIKFSIKNLAKSDVEQAEILKSVKLIYDEDYEYNCFFVTVDKDGDFEGFTSLYSISPLETLEYHMLVEVPSEIKSSSKSLVCRVEADGTTYECVLR